MSDDTSLEPDTAAPEGTDHRPRTESHDPAVPEAYAAFMRQGWGDRELDLPPHPITPYAAARRSRLAEAFPGETLVLPAGGFKVRANDTDYRFRAAIPEAEVVGVISRELLDIDYANHKGATKDDELHDAYMSVWSAMARLQDGKPHP